jgi:glycosyltransferase involved in cell wall biosynthesis
MKAKKLISVVCAVFNEEENVLDCYQAIKKVLVEELYEYDHEIIVCDNASTDRTLVMFKDLALTDRKLKIIANSRNFGAARSAFNGLMHACGDAVIFAISADLQDPPSLIPSFVEKWKQGYQVVYGIRTKRQEKRLLTVMRKLYYRVIQKAADFTIPADVGDFQLLDRVVVDALREMEDYYPYTRGLIPSCGFNRTGVEYTHLKREKGTAKGVPMLLVDMGLNGLISVTKLPMRLRLLSGVVVLLGSLTAFLIYLLYLLAHRSGASAWTAALLVLFFLSGVQLLFLGLLGEYIAAIHFQVRKRPLVIAKEKINFD